MTTPAPLVDPLTDPFGVRPRLDQDGWTVADGLFTADECAAIEAMCAARHWAGGSADLLHWIGDPRWAPLVLPVLGPDIRVVREQLVTKPANAESIVPWHQDAGYSLVAGDLLTCFVALDDITLDNGCLWMAAGSHRRGPLDHVPAGYLKTITEPVDEPVVAVPLARGSAAVFSSLTLHRSGANRTAGTRPAWMVQFCPADATSPTGAPLDSCPRVAVDGAWQQPPRR